MFHSFNVAFCCLTNRTFVFLIEIKLHWLFATLRFCYDFVDIIIQSYMHASGFAYVAWYGVETIDMLYVGVFVGRARVILDFTAGHQVTD